MSRVLPGSAASVGQIQKTPFDKQRGFLMGPKVIPAFCNTGNFPSRYGLLTFEPGLIIPPKLFRRKKVIHSAKFAHSKLWLQI